MTLVSCPKCQHQVSDNAQSCPNCGFQLKSHKITQPRPLINPVPSFYPRPRKKNTWWLVGIGVVIFLILSLCNRSDNTLSSSAPKQKQWYESGTLHTKCLSDWRVATFENKFATSADWAANIKIKNRENYNGDLTSMKSDALMILSCVDEVAKDPNFDMKLVEIVASCMVLMKMN